MFRLFNHLFRTQFKLWDRPSQIGFITGLILVVVMLVIAFSVPQEERTGALTAAGAVWFVTQLVILWANRGMVTPYTRAQRYYLREDFASAVAELERLRAEGKADEKALTLLGNTYRQLGRLDESEEALRLALEIAPNHHFPLYGFGRTLLVKGDYAGAAQIIQKALHAGAPQAVKADLGEAQYRMGTYQSAEQTLRETLPIVGDDPQRRLMVSYLLYKLGGEMPDSALIHAGLPYWQATAERFHFTSYGSSLKVEVAALEQSIGEGI
jgi:tetratricopeptide (TPR) repeat protein